ncbi:MAG: polysaccharide biosynthesis protein, partial [Anaerolineae bacterium]|nr:polysaccharide biosynthesis protein [Anaerolineae bacterium]
MTLTGKRILITGGTGSFGQVVVKRLLAGEMGQPTSITVFSRDEAKQHYMRLSYINKEAATDEVIYQNFQRLLRFRIGDIRDYNAVLEAVREADVVIHAAALKQVPTCEYFPSQAIMTNINGPENLVRAVRSNETCVETVVALSTDKACKPINVMGMTKAVME